MGRGPVVPTKHYGLSPLEPPVTKESFASSDARTCISSTLERRAPMCIGIDVWSVHKVCTTVHCRAIEIRKWNRIQNTRDSLYAQYARQNGLRFQRRLYSSFFIYLLACPSDLPFFICRLAHARSLLIDISVEVFLFRWMGNFAIDCYLLYSNKQRWGTGVFGATSRVAKSLL